MSRETVLIILGVIIALSPYLGLPVSFLGVVLPVLGLLVIGIGASLRIRARRKQATPEIVPAYEAPEN